MTGRTFTWNEVSAHNKLRDLWLVIHGQVYDFTSFVREHPGGMAIILKNAGKDATATYSEVHSPTLVKAVLPPGAQLGPVVPAEKPAVQTPLASPSVASTAATPMAVIKEQKPPLDTLIGAHDFEQVASKTFSPKAWAFVSSAATDLHTKYRNSASYAGITLRPRVLCDVSSVDTSTAMLGCKMRMPIFCGPTAMAKTVFPDGEMALGRACKSAGIPQVVSTSASFPLADIVSAIRNHKVQTPYDVPVFFQLYVNKKREESERLLRQAIDQGVKALFLTVDAPIPGKREADERVKSDESLSSPISGAEAKNDGKGGALGRIMGNYIDASVSWADIPWLRRCMPSLPIILKGIQTSMDAVKAMEAGVEGIVISNHGGRSLDTSPATILVLLELQKCCPQIFEKMEVYVDGGITRGTDIFKALCLGARAVGIGRGLLYALNYGVEGVEKYLESMFSLPYLYSPHDLFFFFFFWSLLNSRSLANHNDVCSLVLRDELETTMKMCGVTSLEEVHPGFVNTLAVDHLIPSSESHPYARWSRAAKSKSRL
jgi:L-lactate dehydrogenase (cytochrome)